MLNGLLNSAEIRAKFIFDGTEFHVEDFKINFAQSIDHKGQPQHETKGGQLVITITQIANNSLYTWAKTANLCKGGQVLFQTDLGITVLRLSFENAYCISLTRSVNSSSTTGTKTTLVISPEQVTINGVEHDNFWTYKQ